MPSELVCAIETCYFGWPGLAHLRGVHTKKKKKSVRTVGAAGVRVTHRILHIWFVDTIRYTVRRYDSIRYEDTIRYVDTNR
jgi:hypothetical protein